MHSRTHREQLAARQDTSSSSPGLEQSFLELDDWCMTGGLTLPLTPPDTISDCTSSDCQDMDPMSWPDHFPHDFSRISMDDAAPPFKLDALSMYASPDGHSNYIPTWSGQISDSVNTDMSPSLSYTSQSSRSLNTFSESEHSWTSTVPHSVSMARHMSSSSSYNPSGIAYPMARTVSGSQFVQDRCDVAGYLPGVLPVQARGYGPPKYSPPRTYLPPHTNPNLRQQPLETYSTVPRMHSRNHVQQRPLFVASAIEDPVEEAFQQLIDLPGDELLQLGDRSSTAMPSNDYDCAPSWPPQGPPVLDARNSIALRMPPSYPRTTRRIADRSSTAQPGDQEDGRYRTDPLYNRGPLASDGLYHCPFVTSSNCGHGPTKLKCNYDKFIDSHLKPFRCKSLECSKQAFSSTACLLRHEREAHGMHGHGKCPHLCPFTGCERSEPGKGFPRLYNCRDHQKRAHGVISSPVSRQAAPVMTTSASARKRKASPTERNMSRKHKHDAAEVRLPMRTSSEGDRSRGPARPYSGR